MTEKLRSHARYAEVEKMMRDYVSSGRSAGMATLVSRGGEIENFASYGRADIASNRPIDANTIYRIYSMTKPITSVALMQLMEQGHFELDDAAKRWLPALGKLEVYQQGKLEADITIRHLLTHTAGFSYGFMPDVYPVDRLYADLWREGIHHKTTQELLRSLLEFPLVAQPGTLWNYSIATDICGHLVELISGMPLADYLQKFIFEPLGMIDTAFEVVDDKVERFATMYGYREDDGLAEIERYDESPFVPSKSGTPVRLHSGGGGLTSTASDYWRFAQMMLNRGELGGRRVIRADTVALMTRNHVPSNLLPMSFNGVAPGAFSGYGFGLGYCINMDPANTAAAGSLGDFAWGGMADTYCWVDPQENLVAILLQQYLPSLHHAGRKDFRNAVYRAIR